ncbi:hypothetical protein HAT2_00691 [Candidatus Similichlamydia laticola]|uniref:Uncharacterized protein n=1 Tax=Candidatus Similichlamydia laticola TaxID=2170265 RepID=A0A369K9E7_9BACT|nr:hypothetical protein HAT2_00691 [Candidatus Similichlamydia laticola]
MGLLLFTITVCVVVGSPKSKPNLQSLPGICLRLGSGEVEKRGCLSPPAEGPVSSSQRKNVTRRQRKKTITAKPRKTFPMKARAVKNENDLMATSDVPPEPFACAFPRKERTLCMPGADEGDCPQGLNPLKSRVVEKEEKEEGPIGNVVKLRCIHTSLVHSKKNFNLSCFYKWKACL